MIITVLIYNKGNLTLGDDRNLSPEEKIKEFTCLFQFTITFSPTVYHYISLEFTIPPAKQVRSTFNFFNLTESADWHFMFLMYRMHIVIVTNCCSQLIDNMPGLVVFIPK